MKVLAALALLLCTLQGVSSYVFSCEEIKAKLINSPRIEPSTSACVFLEEGLDANTPYLSNIFLQDQQDKTSYSLSSVASSPSHCIKGAGPWQVVSDRPADLRCDLEIALLFTSDDKTEYVLATDDDQQHRTSNGRVTFVSPRAGMKITVNNIDADLTVYTGAGKGVNEYLYPLKSWSVWDVPRYFASFDNVLTFDTNAKDVIYFVTAEYRNVSNLGVGEKAVILTSGKSDNVMNKHPEENYLRYNLWEAATANVQGTLSFDPNYGGSINFTVRGDFMNEEQSFTDATIDWKFYASYFEVKYLTSVKPEDVWDNEDTFVIEIQMSELPTDITPIPGIRTDPPVQTDAPVEVSTQQPTKAVLTTPATTLTPVPATDNYCKCGIVDGWFDDWDPATIWVDVIIILDTSKSMGASLEEAKSVITSFVGIMSTDTMAEFYSRIGVIAVSDTVEVVYNLNMSSSDTLDMVQQHNIDKIDVGAAFQAALKMFADGTKVSSYRENAQQIIYYLTNSAPGANMNGVDDFKTDGGIIIVNDYVIEGDVADPGLEKLASDGFFFTDISENYINSLGVFCEANCFCSPDDHPFNDDEISPRTRANRGCFHPVNNGIPQQKARETCQKEGRSLVSIHDQEKELFVNGVASIFGGKKKYWIGLQNDGNQWNWDDKSTNPFTDWDTANNQPNTNGGKNLCAYALQGTGFNVKWTAANCGAGGIIYVCESAPCSIGNKNVSAESPAGRCEFRSVNLAFSFSIMDPSKIPATKADIDRLEQKIDKLLLLFAALDKPLPPTSPYASVVKAITDLNKIKSKSQRAVVVDSQEAENPIQTAKNDEQLVLNIINHTEDKEKEEEYLFDRRKIICSDMHNTFGQQFLKENVYDIEGESRGVNIRIEYKCEDERFVLKLLMRRSKGYEGHYVFKKGNKKCGMVSYSSPMNVDKLMLKKGLWHESGERAATLLYPPMGEEVVDIGEKTNFKILNAAPHLYDNEESLRKLFQFTTGYRHHIKEYGTIIPYYLSIEQAKAAAEIIHRLPLFGSHVIVVEAE